MTRRRVSRSYTLQTLFEMDVRDIWKEEEAISIYDEKVEEFSDEESNDVDVNYSHFLLKGIISKRDQIDKIITKSVTNWPLDKITIIDRNIIRIGIFELLFGNSMDVPERVALNESIELARLYGTEKSSKFVNGVLGFIYREMGEPGKDATIDKTKDIKAVKKVLGAVVYAQKEEEILFALIYDVFNTWTISKSSIDDPKEKDVDAVERIVKEELGLKVQVEYKVGSNDYIWNNPEIGKTRKEASYYLAKAEYDNITLKQSGGLKDAKWFTINEMENLNFYSDMRKIILDTAKSVVARYNQIK